MSLGRSRTSSSMVDMSGVVGVLRDPRFRLRVSAVDGWVTASIDNLTGDGEDALTAVCALAAALNEPPNFINSGWR